MAITPDTEERMIRYLLGELTPEEALSVETQYFEDDEFFQWVQFLEDELLRDFVRGEMDAGLRQRFERRYLNSPELLQKIKLTEAVFAESAKLHLESSAGSAVPSTTAHEQTKFSLRDFIRFRTPIFLYASAAALGLLVTVALFLWTQNSRLQSTIAQLRRENNSLEQQTSRLDRALSEKPKDMPLIASFILNPGVSRNQGAAAPLVIPTGIGMVRLTLPLPPGIKYPGFRIVLEKVPAAQITSQDLSQDALVDSGRSLLVSIPSVSLKPGRYLIYVNGRNERGELDNVQYYVFTIEN